MNMRSTSLSRLRTRLAAGLALLTLSCATHAAVVWQLHDFAFTDGATASGSFTWDETTHRATAWNITTTPGVLTGLNYTDANSAFFRVDALDFFFFAQGSQQFRMAFPDFSMLDTPAAHLMPSGPNTGYIGPNGYEECVNCNPYREGVAGAYLSAEAVSVPEPSTMALSFLALGVLGAMRRRKA
jgi:hypothetical protein